MICKWLAVTIAGGSALAQGLVIPGRGPWAAVILLHGYQEPPRAGGKDFVTWGVRDNSRGGDIWRWRFRRLVLAA